MYKSFKIKNFRCFQSLEISNFVHVNLIAGKNNIGKTALLEALFVNGGVYNPELTLRLNAFRGIEMVKIELGQWTETPWDTLFYNKDISQDIEMKSVNKISGRRSLRLRIVREPKDLARIRQFMHSNSEVTKDLAGSSETAQVLELKYEENSRSGSFYAILDPKGIRYEPIPPPAPFQTFFQLARGRTPIKADAELYGKLEIVNKQEVLLEILKLIEPRLKRITTIAIAGEAVLHGDIGIGRLLPLPVMGEGMSRLTSLVLQIGNAPNGVVLIDEIENGLYHSILPEVWEAIGNAAQEFNTQIFATTHSFECIAAAQKAFSKTKSSYFRLFRLEYIKGSIKAISYDKEALEAAIETGLEIR